MFAIIETNGATHIAIHVPYAGAEKTLPALAAMLENNATFINKGWRDCGTVTPSMKIILGNKFETEKDDGPELLIKADDSVIDDSFVIASPEVFVSNKKALAKKDEEITRLRAEVAHTKNQLESLQTRVAELTESEEQ